MIDTINLRRKVNSTDVVDHIDLHANIRPLLSELIDRLEAAESARCDDYQNWMTALDRNAELLAKLEAAEKAVNEAYQRGYETRQEEIEKERDALRAKIAEMERQEPVTAQQRFQRQQEMMAVWLPWQTTELRKGRPARTVDALGLNVEYRELYALPGAQPAPSVPEDVMRDAERYRYLRARDDGTAGVGCWIEADGRACDRGWLCGVQLDSAIDSFIEVLAAAPKPEGKP